MAARACPTSNPPNELVLTGGSGQQTQLGRQFAQNLQGMLAGGGDAVDGDEEDEGDEHGDGGLKPGMTGYYFWQGSIIHRRHQEVRFESRLKPDA